MPRKTNNTTGAAAIGRHAELLPWAASYLRSCLHATGAIAANHQPPEGLLRRFDASLAAAETGGDLAVLHLAVSIWGGRDVASRLGAHRLTDLNRYQPPAWLREAADADLVALVAEVTA
jgi:hypothetical protein